MSRWGYEHRDDAGLRGLLARWWFRRRAKGIARRLGKQREQIRRGRRV